MPNNLYHFLATTRNSLMADRLRETDAQSAQRLAAAGSLAAAPPEALVQHISFNI
ncbi:hypothetical protein [Cupriavidus necator]